MNKKQPDPIDLYLLPQCPDPNPVLILANGPISNLSRTPYFNPNAIHSFLYSLHHKVAMI